MAESFFATLKNELIYRRPWPTPAKAREAVIGWIAGRYNRRRRHSALGMQTPLEFENTARHTAAQAGDLSTFRGEVHTPLGSILSCRIR